MYDEEEKGQMLVTDYIAERDKFEVAHVSDLFMCHVKKIMFSWLKKGLAQINQMGSDSWDICVFSLFIGVLSLVLIESL